MYTYIYIYICICPYVNITPYPFIPAPFMVPRIKIGEMDQAESPSNFNRFLDRPLSSVCKPAVCWQRKGRANCHSGRRLPQKHIGGWPGGLD